VIFQKAKSVGGFTVVEMLLALAILGVLLASVAVAFQASAINYRENEDMFKAMNSARAALLRITTSLRTAQAVAVTEPVSQCSLITADSQNITYQFNNTDNTLYLITNDDAIDADYVLCRDVTAMTFNRATVPDEPTAIRNVQISMTVSAGNISQTISTAAVVRKNLP